VPPVRGAFWQELAAIALGGPSSALLPVATRCLVVHGAENALHDRSNVEAFVARHRGQVEGASAVLLPGAKHNDFMNFGHPTFEAMVRRVASFALDTAATATAAAAKAAPAAAAAAAGEGTCGSKRKAGSD